MFYHSVLCFSPWLTIEQIALLFNRDRSVISKHIRNVFVESELAEKIGTSQSYYSRIENNVVKPDINMIRKIAKALELEEYAEILKKCIIIIEYYINLW